MTYSISGNENAPILPGIMMRCHTNKCTRVMVLKKYTEGMIVAQADKEGKVYI